MQVHNLISLVVAHDLEGLKTLLSGGGVDLEEKDPAGYTGLSVAARSGDIDTTEMLISFGADVNAVNNVNTI